MTNKSECIEWKGATNSGGYPITWFQGKTAYAHRVLMNALKGEVVLHTCDNPKCVNKDHLRKGTAADNSRDMVEKNRQASGKQCARAKYTEQDILAIRKLKGTLSSRLVAEKFGMSKTNVLDIWNNKIWRNV